MFNNKKGRFWYIPFVFIFLNLSTAIINHASVMSGKPIISFDYSAMIIFASLGVAVLLEFVYLFVEKMVLE